MDSYKPLLHFSFSRHWMIPFVCLIGVLFPVLVQAQSMNLASGATITVDGTSTMHDWTMACEEVEGKADFVMEAGLLKDLRQLELKINVEAMKSEKKGLDKNAYKALDIDQNPSISFSLTQLDGIEAEGKDFRVKCTGTLIVAGNGKLTQLSALCTPETDGRMQCQGSKTLKMTDFGVDPPVFMLGALKTGDEVTIHFDVHFSPLNN